MIDFIPSLSRQQWGGRGLFPLFILSQGSFMTLQNCKYHKKMTSICRRNICRCVSLLFNARPLISRSHRRCTGEQEKVHFLKLCFSFVIFLCGKAKRQDFFSLSLPIRKCFGSKGNFLLQLNEGIFQNAVATCVGKMEKCNLTVKQSTSFPPRSQTVLQLNQTEP